MVKRCYVYNCNTGKKSDRNNEQKYSLFKAPNDKFLLEKWREYVPLRERELNSNDRICAKHFEKRYILPRYQQSRYGDFYEDHIRPKLTPDAVPTLFNDSECQIIALKSSKSNEVPHTPLSISKLFLTHVEVNENDTVPICFKCLLVAAGVTNFFPVIGKSIGLDTAAVGITYTVLPLCVFFLQPLFGLFADYIQNIKLIVISLITAKVTLSVFILFLKPIKEGDQNIYYTHQFWIYMLLIVISCSCLYIAGCLTDVSCYEILGEQTEYYGRQRLFGTAGTGVFTLLTGYVNDLISNEYGHTQYFAGFYLMFVLYFLDMLVLIRIDLPKAKMSTSIISDIKNLAKMKEFITLCVSIFVIGNLAGLQANFLFWYLTDLGANQTLLGMTIAVQCLVAEIPFFFFSGWFVKNLGYFNCLTCSFVGFTIRFGLYYLLKNPWLVLPIETLHGLTFAVFYASLTAFASAYAPPGTEAFVLGLLCGIYQGLGISVGSFLGGLSFKEFGGNRTFLIASCLSTLCIPATFMFEYFFKRNKYEKLMKFDNEVSYKVY